MITKGPEASKVGLDNAPNLDEASFLALPRSL